MYWPGERALITKVWNGKDRPIYRINVKFFGSLFGIQRGWLG